MPTIDWDQKRNEWITAVQELCHAIRSWSEARGWFVHEDKKRISEEHLGTYDVPALLIECPVGRIHIDPVGRNIIGADGRVDILSFPSLNRLLLLRIGNAWRIKTDSRIDWPEPWSEESFINLVNALTAAA